MGETQAKKKKAPLSMWKVILIVIAVVYVMSFIIPSGAYERDGKMAIPGTYQIIDKIYLNPAQVILAVGDLVYSTFGKLFVTLIIMGGMMGIVNSTGVLGQEIAGLAPYSGSDLRTIVTILNLTVVSACLIFWVKRCQKNPEIYAKNFGGENAVEEGDVPGADE